MNKTVENKISDGTCILVAAGDFSLADIEIKENDLCISVDGGYLYCKMLGIVPHVIIGDMDSVDEETFADILAAGEANPERVVVLDREKDDTDTLAALRLGLERGYRTFRIYGAMGGRTEHTIANIQCMSYLKNQGAKAYIMDANVMMTVIKNESVKFKSSMEGYLSVFALGDRAEGVTIEGMKYELDNAVITNDYPIGISNEFVGKEGMVTVRDGMLLLIVAWA